MSHLFESDYNQTQLYPDNVTSISRIMELSGTDLSLVISNLKNNLQTYFGRYYTSATVDVTVLNADAASARVSVSMDIRVFDQGQQITSTWQFTSENNVIVQILNLSNYGV